MGDRAVLQRCGSRVAECWGLLQHERCLLPGVTGHQHWRAALGQRQQPVGMPWADGKVNHNAEDLDSISFDTAAPQVCSFSSSRCVAEIVFLQREGFTGFSVKLKYK